MPECSGGNLEEGSIIAVADGGDPSLRNCEPVLPAGRGNLKEVCTTLLLVALTISPCLRKLDTEELVNPRGGCEASILLVFRASWLLVENRGQVVAPICLSTGVRGGTSLEGGVKDQEFIVGLLIRGSSR